MLGSELSRCEEDLVMGGRLEFDFRIPKPTETRQPRRQEEDPFRILIVGDFHGDGPRDADAGFSNRALVPVDIDNFDHVLRRAAPRIALSGEGPDAVVEEIAFSDLADFHPDALYERLDAFVELRQLRARLLDADSFEAAAATLVEGIDPTGNGAVRGGGDDDEAGAGTMFERLLGGRPVAAGSAGPTSRGEAYAAQMIERLVAPHIDRGVDTDRQSLLVAAIDDTIARRMRVVLHDPRFQALEAAWRGLWWLTSSLETGADLQIDMLDASRSELAADLLGAGDDIEATSLCRRLAGGGADTSGTARWSLLIGVGRFGPSGPDLQLLAALGAIASHAGGPFVAEADPALIGTGNLAVQPDAVDWTPPDAETEERWRALRRSPVAPWIGLALPRVLLRLPYGSKSDPIDAFAFEEMAGGTDHESLLWGTPAIACALIMGRSFAENGWHLEAGVNIDLDDLPAFTFSEDGEMRLKPCAEVLLSHRTADAIMARGIMPVLSHRDRNAVRFPRIHSIADPPAALSGPWR